jgi:hypothetical protein
MWYALDGDHIKVSTTRDRQKDRNITWARSTTPTRSPATSG